MENDGSQAVFGPTTATHAFPAGAAVALLAPSPNPTPSGTTVSFRLPRPEFVRLDVVDATGRHVRTLERSMLAPGEYQRWWDGAGDGRPAAPGLYFVTLRTSEGLAAQRVAVVR